MNPLDISDIDFLGRQALCKQMGRAERARLLIHVQRLELAAGERLYGPDSVPDRVFLVRSGRLEFLGDNGGPQEISSGPLGEELVLGGAHYFGSVTALEPAVLFILPRRQLVPVVEESPKVRGFFFEAMLARLSPGDEPAQAPQGVSPPVVPSAGGDGAGVLLKLLGWVLAVAAPLEIWQFGPSVGLGTNATYFLAIIAATMSMWLFNLVPAFVAPLFSVLAFILFDVAPARTAVAGFASDGFFMLLAIFAVGALMVMSGLTYRMSLLILRFVPGSPFWYGLSVFLPGVLLTPILPSQLGRTVIVAPAVSDLIEASGAGPNDRMAGMFVVSSLMGLSLMASIFLTGKPANLIIFGMFDAQTQFAFQWVQWFWGSLVCGLVLLVLYLLCIPIFFWRNRSFHIPRHIVRSQLRMLGPLSAPEWITLMAIVVLLAGILTTAFHKVEIPWMSMAILLALLFFGALSKEDLSRRIDWSVLIFIGSIIAWVPVMKMTGIEAVIARTFSWVGVYMKSDLELFILALCGLIILLRFALPELVAEILLVTILFPLAQAAGVSLWLIGFVVLTMCEMYIFPYQAPYFVQMKNLLSSAGLDGRYAEGRVIAFNVAMTLARVVAIYASIPFWKYLKIV